MTFWAQKLLRQPDTASAATKVMGSRFFAGSSSSWTSWMHGLFSSSTVGRRDHASRLGLNRAHWEDIRTTGSRRKLQEAAGSHCLAILALCWRRWWSHYKFTPCRPRSSQTKSQLSPHPFAWLVPQVSCFQSGMPEICWKGVTAGVQVVFVSIWHLDAFGMFDFKGVGGTWRTWGWNTTSLVQILLFARFLPFPRISSSQTQGPTFTSLFPCLSCLVQNLEYTYYIILHINIIIGLDLHSSLCDPALTCHVLMIPWTYSKDLQGLDGSSPRASAFTTVYITKLCSYDSYW